MKHNWEYKRLGDIGTIVTGSTPQTSNEEYYNSKDYMFVKPGDISENGISELQSSESFISELAFKKACRPLPAQSILVTCIGIIGKVGILPKAATCNQQINAIVPNIGLSRFIAYAILSIKSELKAKKNGPIVPIINKTQFSNFRVPVPPMEVQKQIVEELDKINEIIEDCRELLRNLDTLAQSLFYDFFGDPVLNPKGWKVNPLKDAVIEMFLGPFGSALKTDCYVTKKDGYAMVYEQKHAIKKTLNQENHFIDKAKFDSLKRFEILPNDFIMSCRGTIGQLYQVPNNSPRGIIHPSVMKIRLNPSKYNASFFKFLLPVIVKEQQTKGNCVQMAITAKELGGKSLPVPPLTLQEKFAARIEQIEAQKKIVEEMIVNLQTLLDSRMDYWFN